MATLVEIREQLVRQTGRFDLVVDSENWADNGADWYIRAGQRMLDELSGTPLQTGRWFEIVSAGTYALNVTGCRSIREVWVSTAGGSSWQLKWFAPREFRWRFPEPWGLTAVGTPEAWTLGRLRSVPDGATVDRFNSSFGGDVESFPENLTELGIVWQPAAGEELQVEVVGDFETPTLSSETDQNYWSVRHPDLLVLAAQYKLETATGNFERQRDWLSEIQARLVGIEKDFIATEVWQASELRG